MANGTDIPVGSAEERKGMAFAALIIALCGLFCAFIPGWMIFSGVCALVAIIVASFCIYKAKRPGGRARLALWALGTGILSILVAAYFLLTRTTTPGTPGVVEEPVQQVSPAPSEAPLDKLQQATDSSNQH
jgi:hypothetical protein